MGHRTAIEWTDVTWNPTTGCSRVSAGCDNCYAEALARRLLSQAYTRRLPVVDKPANRQDPFAVRVWPERLVQPSRWRDPRLVFVNSMSDLFHVDVPHSFVRAVFEVMMDVDRHIYQVLTKRPSRAARFVHNSVDLFGPAGLPRHIWIGTSTENQETVYRARHLREIPAAVRFLSCEPLIGPLTLDRELSTGDVHWVIVGGESGIGHRPMDSRWATQLRDECVEADVPFFFKQWGGRTPKSGGRELEGREWNQMPSVERRVGHALRPPRQVRKREKAMMDDGTNPKFGGDWTREKLDILERYLNAYTTALKNKPFTLVYIDAFAGTGEIDQDLDLGSVSLTDRKDFVMGSTVRALRVTDRPFDRLLFIEKDPERCAQLRKLADEHKICSIDIHEADANDHLRTIRLSEYGKSWRGVLFLDPFGAQLDWATLEHVAQLERLDTWLLFPVGTIARMLPQSKNPDDVSPSWADRLTRVYGNESWRELYSDASQGDLFGSSGVEREKGADGLLRIYKDRLRTAFGPRLLEQSRTLMNSRNSPLFEFIFCAGHPRGTETAKRIAGHLVWSQA